jgi:hypothetical protein
MVPRQVAWRTGLIAHALANTLRLPSRHGHGLAPGALSRARRRRGQARAHRRSDRRACVAGACRHPRCGGSVVAVAGRAGTLLVLLAGLACAALLLLESGLGVWVRTRGCCAGRVACFALAVEMAAALAGPGCVAAGGALPEARLRAALRGRGGSGRSEPRAGGLGVFEASILAAAKPEAHPQVLAALLAYRFVYNLLPFAMRFAGGRRRVAAAPHQFDGGYAPMSRCCFHHRRAQCEQADRPHAAPALRVGDREQARCFANTIA